MGEAEGQSLGPHPGAWTFFLGAARVLCAEALWLLPLLGRSNVTQSAFICQGKIYFNWVLADTISHSQTFWGWPFTLVPKWAVGAATAPGTVSPSPCQLLVPWLNLKHLVVVVVFKLYSQWHLKCWLVDCFHFGQFCINYWFQMSQMTLRSISIILVPSLCRGKVTAERGRGLPLFHQSSSYEAQCPHEPWRRPSFESSPSLCPGTETVGEGFVMKSRSGSSLGLLLLSLFSSDRKAFWSLRILRNVLTTYRWVKLQFTWFRFLILLRLDLTFAGEWKIMMCRGFYMNYIHLYC